MQPFNTQPGCKNCDTASPGPVTSCFHENIRLEVKSNALMDFFFFKCLDCIRIMALFGLKCLTLLSLLF